MKKRQTINSTDLDRILESCTKLDQKSFTIALKQIERASGGSYCCLSDKQAQYVFDECFSIFNKNDNSIVQYNALRLAKYAVDTRGALSKDYKNPWALYLKTIFHSDGRVRIAGVHLLDRYYFGLSFDLSPIRDIYKSKSKVTDKESEEIGRFVVEKFLYLQDLEDKYIQEHEEELDEDDFPDFAGKVPWASDTKDKFLKTIRMGVEVFFTRGPLEELMERFGYQQKKSDEFPDLTIFQRYEKVHDNKTLSNSKNMQIYIIRAKLQHNKRTYRDIEVPEGMTLYYVAKGILDSFDFNFDHLFAFGNKPVFYDSDIQYELKTEDDLFEDNTRGDVEKTAISEVPFFQQRKDKMYFLFDFGDDWEFEIELKDFGKYMKGEKYPIVLKVNGNAPPQYPEWD